MENRTCPACGRTFHPKARATVFCSFACAQQRRRRAEDRESAYCTAARVAPCSLDDLMCARKRPKNCSPVRWRMELSRRKLQRNGGINVYAMLPDPDRLN